MTTIEQDEEFKSQLKQIFPSFQDWKVRGHILEFNIDMSTNSAELKALFALFPDTEINLRSWHGSDDEFDAGLDFIEISINTCEYGS